MHGEVADRLVARSQLGYHLLQVIGKGDGGLDLARPLAGRAGLLGAYDGRLTDTLSCDLHETELAQR